MKTYLDCIPCFLNQGLKAARISGLDIRNQKKILDEISRIIPDISLDMSPPEIALDVYRTIKKASGINDPFKKVKRDYIEFALGLYPELKRIVHDAGDPLLSAIRLSIAGNIIDFGVGDEFNVEKTVKETMNCDFSIIHYERFRNELKEANNILYIGDNAGETVFDRILIEELDRDVVYAVRDEPVINDAVYEDAVMSGLGNVSRIISSGCSAPGTILSYCNKEFMEIYKNADIVLAKGQGNYETLSEANRGIYFLLRVKCPVIARDVNVDNNSIVLKRHEG